MRGTVEISVLKKQLKGIIPAHAGNSLTISSNNSPARDHPRACGEQGWQRRRGRDTWGSSPRMRGTARIQRRQASTGGIIPAHAGNRLSGKKSHKDVRDHPRACGEQPALAIKFTLRAGSSPRMRGTGDIEVIEYKNHGIIPAHAGNSFTLLVLVSL